MQTLSIDRLVGLLLGNYRVERLLGQGSLNAVYLARNVITQSVVALTLFIVPDRFSPGARSRFLHRFRQEAATLTTLKHPHILSVYEYGELSGFPYLITPYMMNGSLANILKQKGRFSHERVLYVLEQIVEGLAYAHSREVVHGMLKPANIVFSAEQRMMVAGFGLMHILQIRGVEHCDEPYAHLLNIARTFLAAPEYLAPEVVQGHPVNMRSDIYALGTILFELLSGQPPFSGKDPIDTVKKHVEQKVPPLHLICPEVPIALESVVNQALERDPARRFQHVSALLEAFTEASRDVKGPSRHSTWQLMPPIVTGKLEIASSQEEAHPDMALWTSSIDVYADGYSTTRLQPPERSRKMKRRQVIALLATSSVAVAGIAVAANTQLFRTEIAPQPPMPTLIGNVNMPPNSATAFMNQANQQASLLIRGADGEFSALERLCTHQPVNVNYDVAKQQLICPAHGAVFDPVSGEVIGEGPAKRPLTQVAISVNEAGNITTA
jgi:serine/threonine-protein kinase